MNSNETEHRVYYSDTDHGGAAYYANYLKWFEIGRTEILRKHGFNYSDFEKKGLIAPVVEVKCTYKSPARYDDIIVLKTKIASIGNSSIRFDYEITGKKAGTLLAEGYTVNVFVDIKSNKPIKVPDELRKAFS